MKEILKIIYIAVCSSVCLYPIYRWIEDAVYEIGSSRGTIYVFRPGMAKSVDGWKMIFNCMFFTVFI
ncbi:hypothetical protein [uncultured Thomasclavelia sp.]|uniref:hypothetical protein n=1 Tax=uncultured Thomasclavelia sp. TaxID=3025759 RepID=UPI002596E397|nr:hypothetical protein [uncultured Thomasclavelia sp.]